MRFNLFSRRIRARRASPLYLAEPMERRLLLAGVDQTIGNLAGRFFKQNHVFGSDTDAFHFTVAQGGHIDIQLSRKIGTGNMSLRNANGVISTTAESTDDQEITFDPLFAGDFTLSVKADPHQLAPAMFYTLAITTDFAPDAHFSGSPDLLFANTSRNMGVLSEASNNRANDFIGYFDTSGRDGKDLIDVYGFQVPSAGDVDVILGGLTLVDPAGSQAKVGADVTLFRDSNNDGLLSPSEAIRTASTGGINVAELFPQQVNPGRFFVEVSRLNIAVNDNTGGSNYHLDFLYHTADLPGETLDTARSVTLTNANQTFKDHLSSVDTIDVYKFTANSGGPFNFNASLTGLTSGDFDLQLVEDVNHNNVIDVGELRSSSAHRGTGNEQISRLLTVPDSYFLLVKRFSGEDAYTLTMSLPSTDFAGNTITNAKNLVLLNNAISVGDFVGPIDTSDFYKINVAQPGEIRVDLASPTNGSVAVDVIRDANNNGAINAGEVLGTLSTGQVLDGVVLPVAGNYFLRVRPTTGGNANYSVTFTVSKQLPFNTTPFQISNTNLTGTKIEAEDFDFGGEGVAYHDTTADNLGGEFRTSENGAPVGVDMKPTNDTGGGFRISNTAVGEFLEYTILVNQAGNYDFAFRVSSNHSGASFHGEIDGTNLTGSIPFPNTGAFDNMTTVTQPNLPLTKGPHVLRLAFDTSTGFDNGFAGSFNFVTIIPSTSGTFTLKPTTTTVPPNKRTTLALAWTVPTGTWRVLKQVQLRLRDEHGTTLWLVFDEAADTLRLYDPATNRFGTPKAPGSNGVLSSGGITLHLGTSSVKASSPASRTVVLSLDFSFASSLAGRHFTVEAAASDDLGHSDPFKLAGHVNVIHQN